MLKEHETFVAALLSYCNRYNALDREARDLLSAFRGSEGRFVVKLNSLREKSVITSCFSFNDLSYSQFFPLLNSTQITEKLILHTK